MMTVEQLEGEVLGLPEDERAKLAELLLASLEVDSETEAAWRIEIARRCKEIADGTTELIPAAQAFAEVRASLSSRLI